MKKAFGREKYKLYIVSLYKNKTNNNNIFGIARFTCETWTSPLHPTEKKLLIQLRHKSALKKFSFKRKLKLC